MNDQTLTIDIALQGDDALRQLADLDASLQQLQPESAPSTTPPANRSAAAPTQAAADANAAPPAATIDQLQQIKAELRLIAQLMRDLQQQLQPFATFFTIE